MVAYRVEYLPVAVSKPRKIEQVAEIVSLEVHEVVGDSDDSHQEGSGQNCHQPGVHQRCTHQRAEVERQHLQCDVLRLGAVLQKIRRIFLEHSVFDPGVEPVELEPMRLANSIPEVVFVEQSSGLGDVQVVDIEQLCDVLAPGELYPVATPGVVGREGSQVVNFIFNNPLQLGMAPDSPV